MKHEKSTEKLSQAINTIEARGESYGNIEENWKATSLIWNGLLKTKLKHDLTPADVGLLMAGLKLARLSFNPDHEDSQIDGAAYIALISEVV